MRAAVAMAEALAVCGRRDEAVAVARRWEAHSERRLACAQALAHWLATTMTARPPTPSAPTRPPPTRRARPSPRSSSATSGSRAATSSARCAGFARARSCCAARTRSGCARPRSPGIAQVAAQAGDAAHARAVVAQLDNAPGRGVGEELGLARAWTAHVSGDRAEAVRIATAVADAATARGALGFAARADREIATPL